MAVYAYIYSGFPETKDRKYYVCNYRRGNAYTYQVVPQLQRRFDAEGWENKHRIGWERFKRLRKRGHLYTSSQSHERSSLYEYHGEEVPEEWEFLVDWLCGESWPGEVDWSRFGRRLRENLQHARRPSGPVHHLGLQVVAEDGEFFASLYDTLRKRHLKTCWIHRWREHRLGELCAPGDDYPQPIGAATLLRGGFRGEAGEVEAGRFRMHELVREARLDTGRLDEVELRAQLATAVGLRKASSWSTLLEALGPREEWYASVESADGDSVSVPDERTYDVLWALDRRLGAIDLHHACAPRCAPDHSRALHARFHDGARRAVVVELEGYPETIRREALAREVHRAADGGVLDGWTTEGLEALVAMLCEPATGRLAAAAPTSETVAEFVMWPLDEAIRIALDSKLPEGRDWCYSRLGHEVVVSSPARHDAEILADARRLVGELLSEHGWTAKPESTRLWRSGGEPLVVGGLIVPEQPGEPIRFRPEEGERVDAAVDAARDGEVDAQTRELLSHAYAVTGDVGYPSMLESMWGREVRALLESITISEFVERAREGWIGEGPLR